MRISGIKSQKSADRAITYYLLAKEFGWTIKQIDESPVDKILELIEVHNLYSNKGKGKSPPRSKGRSR